MRLCIFLISIFFGQIAYCCSCVPLGVIDEKQYTEYSLIAKGKISKVVEGRFSRTIYLKVDTYYRGDQKERTIKIESPSASSMCGIFPTIGESWLIFAYTFEKTFKTHLCTRTKNMNSKAWDYRGEELKEDLEFLETKRSSNIR